MLLLLLYHLVVTLICSLAGILFYSFLRENSSRSLIFYPITGLLVITLITQIIALVAPIDALAFLFISALLLLCCVWKRKLVYSVYHSIVSNIKQIPIAGLVLIGSIWLVILQFSAGPTLMDDTESYHIQMIKWLREYGTVPGIANLHERYGFNSSWFSTISFFLPFSSTSNFFTALNGLLSVWMSVFLISKFSKRVSSHPQQWPIATSAFVVFSLSILCFPLLRGNAATSNYDFVTTFLIVVLFFETIQAKRSSALTSEWFLWPVFLFTVRIVNFPLLLLSIASLMIRLRKKQQVLKLLTLSFLLVIPFLARNVMLSGYPFYPARAFDLFQVDWKVDALVIDSLLDFIKYFNRVNDMFLPIETTRQLPFPNWVGPWFRFLFTYDKLVLVPGLLGFSCLLLSFRRISTYSRALLFFCIVLLVQLISWFCISPDPRFVYGPLLVGSVLAVFFIQRWIPANPLKQIATILPPGIALLLLVYSFSKIRTNKNYQYLIRPEALIQPPLRQVFIDTIPLNIPERVLNNWNPRCFGSPLPCLYEVDPRLQLRGTTLKEGFRLAK